MRIKLDENLGKQCVELLHRVGHEVATVPEQGLCSAPDSGIIEACRTEGRCLVTLDLDFGNPLLFRHSDYRGVALLRLPPRSTPTDLTAAVRTLMTGLERENIEGKLWIVQPGRIREYRPEDDAD